MTWHITSRTPVAGATLAVAVLVCVSSIHATHQPASSWTEQAPPNHVPNFGGTKVAVFASATNLSGNAYRYLGRVSKQSAPVMKQDRPWEPRLDNGYPNVVYHNATDTWELWYGDCILSPPQTPGSKSDCSVQTLLYANSTDGIHWHKPDLGVFNLSSVSWTTPQLRPFGTRNNIVLDGGGVGVYRDPTVPAGNLGAYKAFGVGCFIPGGGSSAASPQAHPDSTRTSDMTSSSSVPSAANSAKPAGCVSGTGLSFDGIHWTNASAITWPKPQRYDCHQNMFFDTKLNRYVLTTRAYDPPQASSSGRCIANAMSKGSVFGDWPGSVDVVEVGTPDNQLYSQVTFPWLDVYLGIVMVYDALEPTTQGRVHCRLSFSKDLKNWQWVDTAGGVTGRDFIPLGSPGSFDDHICFAAAFPVCRGAERGCRLYYMGGNGPHSGVRNSSLGLAGLRMDGFVGIAAGGSEGGSAQGTELHVKTGTAPSYDRRGGSMTQLSSGSFSLYNVTVSGPYLTVTADVFDSSGTLRAGAIGAGGLSPAHAVPITTNVTDGVVKFEGGATFAKLVGREITLEVSLTNAVIYSIGFSQGQ